MRSFAVGLGFCSVLAIAACRGSASSPASAVSGDAAVSLARVVTAAIEGRFDDTERARVARSCDVYCQTRTTDGGCDPGATLGAGLSLTVARPEIVLGEPADGDAGVDRGFVVYVLREVREPGRPVIWSPACQQRQQRFSFDRAGSSLAFNSVAAPHDTPFDFLPDLPDASVARDFCSTRDTRLSEASDGGVFATTQITIGNVNDAGLCSQDGGLDDVVIFASFDIAYEPSVAARNANDDFLSPDGPGGDTALYCGTLQRSTDDIPTALIAGDRFAALFCSNLLDTVGIAPRHYAVVRSAPDDGALRIYRVPVYEPDGGLGLPAVWIRTGGQQGSLTDARVPGRAVGRFVFAASSADAGDVSRLAWFLFDFDADGGAGGFVRDGGAIVGGYLPRPAGLTHVVEKYALGLARDTAGNHFIAYLTEEAGEYCSVELTSQTTCFKDDTGHLRIRVVDSDFGRALADVSVARGDAPSSVDPPRLLMAPTHPDLVVRDDRVFIAHGYSHYPASGCGSDGGAPCRGKNDIATQTAVLDVWRIDRQ